MPGCAHPIIASGTTPIGSVGRAPDGKIYTSRKSIKKFPSKREDVKKKHGKIFGSIDSSFIPIERTGGVPDENIEEPDKFGYCIALDENTEEPDKMGHYISRTTGTR